MNESLARRNHELQEPEELIDETTGTDWLGLTGARVLVVGAGGIGTQCAKGYAAAGARLLVADRNPAALSALASDPAFHGQLETLEIDLTEPGSGDVVVQAAVERLGGLDVVLHCV